MASKKESQRYTAHRAALGGRTIKTGQSRCFVGYKKYTLRLWWREHTAAVLLVPLVTWVAPANVSEGGFLVPSLRVTSTGIERPVLEQPGQGAGILVR